MFSSCFDDSKNIVLLIVILTVKKNNKHTSALERIFTMKLT